MKDVRHHCESLAEVAICLSADSMESRKVRAMPTRTPGDLLVLARLIVSQLEPGDQPLDTEKAQERLAFLRREQAITADPSTKFNVRKEIEDLERTLGVLA